MDSNLNPGDLINYRGQVAQIVWIGTFHILADHRRQLTDAMMLFYIKTGKFETLVETEDTRFDDYYFSKENIGPLGL